MLALDYAPGTCEVPAETGHRFTARNMNSRLPPDFKDQ